MPQVGPIPTGREAAVMSETTVAASSIPSAHAADHPLDNPIWGALTSRQRVLAIGDTRARRYPTAVAPFGGIIDTSSESFASLAQCIAPADRMAMFTADRIEPPAATFEVVRRARADQMVGFLIAEPSPAINPISLAVADVADMMELVDISKPGPFGPRTHELGRYLGIRVDGKLVALVGERVRLDGFTEISAVCTHPDYRGRGYSRALVSTLSRAIRDHGETPFLHVFSDNEPAIALYRKVGFQVRRTMHLTVLGTTS